MCAGRLRLPPAGTRTPASRCGIRLSPRRGVVDLAALGAAGPTRLGAGPYVPRNPLKERLVLEAFFITLMILVCVGTAAFAGLTVKKLFQGQR
ncbi:hypothetical protein GCM10028832_26780 [Streptomyces sparsus]